MACSLVGAEVRRIVEMVSGLRLTLGRQSDDSDGSPLQQHAEKHAGSARGAMWLGTSSGKAEWSECVVGLVKGQCEQERVSVM